MLTKELKVKGLEVTLQIFSTGTKLISVKGKYGSIDMEVKNINLGNISNAIAKMQSAEQELDSVKE